MSLEQWQNIVGNGWNYIIDDNESNRYVFLSLRHLDTSEAAANKQVQPFDDDAMAVLRDAASRDASKTMHVFMHFPLNSLRPSSQFAGLGALDCPNADGYGVGGTYSGS